MNTQHIPGLRSIFLALSIPLWIWSVSCERPEVEPVDSSAAGDETEASAPATIYLPVDRTITDAQGRELEVTITGKSDTEITFNRKSDGKEYSLPIASLSDPDRAYLATVVPREVEESDPEPENEAKETRLDNLDEAISRLNEEIEVITLKLTGLDPNSPRARGFEKEISRLRSEIVDLKVEMQRIERN